MDNFTKISYVIAGTLAMLSTVLLVVLYQRNHQEMNPITASDTKSTTESSTSSTEPTIEDAKECISETKDYIDELHSNIDSATSAADGDYDEINDALHSLDYSSSHSCMDDF